MQRAPEPRAEEGGLPCIGWSCSHLPSHFKACDTLCSRRDGPDSVSHPPSGWVLSIHVDGKEEEEGKAKQSCAFRALHRCFSREESHESAHDINKITAKLLKQELT